MLDVTTFLPLPSPHGTSSVGFHGPTLLHAIMSRASLRSVHLFFVVTIGVVQATTVASLWHGDIFVARATSSAHGDRGEGSKVPPPCD